MLLEGEGEEERVRAAKAEVMPLPIMQIVVVGGRLGVVRWLVRGLGWVVCQ